MELLNKLIIKTIEILQIIIDELIIPLTDTITTIPQPF